MNKIPTLFKRIFDNNGKCTDCIPELSDPKLQCVLDGATVPTLKVDGACCAIIDGKFYKRYDAKRGKTPPPDAIPCCEPDPVTGHWPHWLPVKADDPSAKWFIAAKENAEKTALLPMERMKQLGRIFRTIHIN